MWPTDFRLGDFVVQPATDRLTRGDLRVELEPKTMAVLLALAARPGEVVSSEELIRDIWHDRAMGDNPVYKSVAKLRRALDDEADEPRYIETIPRKGYRLLMKPQPLAESLPEAPTSGRRTWIGVAAAALALLAIGVGYGAFRPGAATQPASATPAVVTHVYFPGFDSDAPEVVAINALIRDRLSQLPGLALSERAVDAPLATIRLSGSARTDGKRLRVQLRLDGERGADLWSSDLTLPLDEGYRVANRSRPRCRRPRAFPGATSCRLRSVHDLAGLPAGADRARERRAGFRQRLMIASAEVVRADPGLRRARRSGPTPACSQRPLTLPAENPRDMQCARDAWRARSPSIPSSPRHTRPPACWR